MAKITKDTISDIIIPSLITALILGVVFAFFRPVKVIGSSMEKNYHDGDRLIASATAEIDYGDVIVFKCKNKKETLIKRVIAKEGDTVDIDFEAGTVSVNGEILDESKYTNEPTTLDEEGQTYPLTVPENCYFVLGDNRMHSVDSRSSEVGFVEEKTVIGKIVYKIGG